MMFWGYLHSNGTIQCKRWFGDVRDYSTSEGGDCHNNPFTLQIIEPFESTSNEAAYEFIAQRLNQIKFNKKS